MFRVPSGTLKNCPVHDHFRCPHCAAKWYLRWRRVRAPADPTSRDLLCDMRRAAAEARKVECAGAPCWEPPP